MESVNDKYICSRNDDLYIYTYIRGHLRKSCFFKYYNRQQHYANFSNSYKFILPEYLSSCAAANIGGRNNRYMEPGQYQHVCAGNGDLYIYTIIRGCLRKSGFFKHYHREQHHANFSNHCQLILPECNSSGTANNI